MNHNGKGTKGEGGVDDFNPDQMVREHGKDITDIKARLEKLESKFGSNEQIADTLCETSEKASKMQELLANSFTKLIKQNSDVQGALTDFINKADRNAVKELMKKIGFGVWTLIVAVVSGAVVFFLKK